VTIDQFRTLSNHQIFISLARGLHQYFDHGGTSWERDYLNRLFQAFFFQLQLKNVPSLTLLTGEFFHNREPLGHIKEERENKTSRIRCTMKDRLEDLGEEAFRYLLIQEIVHYYESGQARIDGWHAQIPLNFSKAMRTMLELDFDFSEIVAQHWKPEDLIDEGKRRLNAKLR